MVVLADGEVGAIDGAGFVAIEAGSGAAGAGVSLLHPYCLHCRKHRLSAST